MRGQAMMIQASDQEVLVAFRGTAEQGWYAYTYWANAAAISEHNKGCYRPFMFIFKRAVDVTGSPTITVTNDQLGDPGGSQLQQLFVPMLSGTGGHQTSIHIGCS